MDLRGTSFPSLDKQRSLTICAQAMPSDDHKTFYSPGDLYDLLSSSAETRFHAAYLFMRYHMQVRSDSSSASSTNAATQPPEDQEALEAVTWDVAVACLALSVKVRTFPSETGIPC